MDLGRFSRPMDVAVDQKQIVYVANTDEQEIQVFNSDGSFFMKAGVEQYRIEKSEWDPATSEGVVVDSTESEGIIFYVVEEKGILESPQAVTVDDRGVIYVCDTPNSRIIRYALSNTIDEDLVDNP
jgi:putative ribosome biogenesis GTPase RsgA